MTTVQFVLTEELMLQNVNVQKDNITMKLTSVDHVTTNVKDVLLTELVMNVLKVLTELAQLIVNVLMDIMIITLKFVNYVLSNVTLVLKNTFVILVVVIELTHHLVNVQNIYGKLMKKPIVNLVLINVKVVTLLMIVENVLETELTLQLVTVHILLVSMTMVMLNVQNVHVTVTLVMILLNVTSVLVSEFKLQNVFVQKDGTLLLKL